MTSLLKLLIVKMMTRNEWTSGKPLLLMGRAGFTMAANPLSMFALTTGRRAWALSIEINETWRMVQRTTTGRWYWRNGEPQSL